MEQVIELLGAPIRRDSSGERTMYCQCNPKKRCPEKCHFTFTYTPHNPSAWSYPMLWVHFNERKRVQLVYVKEYMMWDERGVYTAQENPCDPTDPIIPLSDDDAFRVCDLGDLFEEE